MSSKVYVVGVGMTKFEKPGSRAWDYPDMAKEAGTKALEDAGIPYDEIDQAVVGYVYGESTSGQRAVYQLGLTGIPVYNVNNNCSTGSTALFLGKQLIEGGLADCVLALGVEKMEKGLRASAKTIYGTAVGMGAGLRNRAIEALMSTRTGSDRKHVIVKIDDQDLGVLDFLQHAGVLI